MRAGHPCVWVLSNVCASLADSTCLSVVPPVGALRSARGVPFTELAPATVIRPVFRAKAKACPHLRSEPGHGLSEPDLRIRVHPETGNHGPREVRSTEENTTMSSVNVSIASATSPTLPNCAREVAGRGESDTIADFEQDAGSGPDSDIDVLVGGRRIRCGRLVLRGQAGRTRWHRPKPTRRRTPGPSRIGRARSPCCQNGRAADSSGGGEGGISGSMWRRPGAGRHLRIGPMGESALATTLRFDQQM